MKPTFVLIQFSVYIPLPGHMNIGFLRWIESGTFTKNKTPATHINNVNTHE